MKNIKFIIIFVYIIYLFKLTYQEEPALKVNLNPPEEDTKDIINALKDLANLENDLRIGANEDFNEEKKKLIELQKSRVHDIVHSAFIALSSLIPNPIKASIRKAIRDHIQGTSSSDNPSDPSKSIAAVSTDITNKDIRDQEGLIRNIDAKFKQISGISNKDSQKNINYNVNNLNKPIENQFNYGVKSDNAAENIKNKYTFNNYSDNKKDDNNYIDKRDNTDTSMIYDNVYNDLVNNNQYTNINANQGSYNGFLHTPLM